MSEGVLATALRKVEETPVPPVRKLALAFAGGLDSTLCALLAQRKYGAEEVVPILVDIGQGREELQEARDKATQLGLTPVVIDVQDEFSGI
jgi:argininosuccinate synthase